MAIPAEIMHSWFETEKTEVYLLNDRWWSVDVFLTGNVIYAKCHLYVSSTHEYPGLRFKSLTGAQWSKKSWYWYRTGWEGAPPKVLTLIPERVCLYILGMSEVRESLGI